MKEAYSKIPINTFHNIGVNAAMILSDFDPTTGSFNTYDIIGATSGGIQFNATPEYEDWGEDIDNCPKNTKELKRLTDWDISCSGTFVSINGAMAQRLAAVADKTKTGQISRITPRDVLDIHADFKDIWIVGDYSSLNTGSAAGFIAIHMLNTLNTGGFQLQTDDKKKMQFSFEFTAHYSNDAQDTVPYEIYIREPIQGVTPIALVIDKNRLSFSHNDTAELTARVVGDVKARIKWEATVYYPNYMPEPHTIVAISPADSNDYVTSHTVQIQAVEASMGTIAAYATLEDSTTYSTEMIAVCPFTVT